MGQWLTRAVALVCTGGLSAGCGSVWHPVGSGFSSIQDGEDLQTQWVSLQTKYAGDGDALAADLGRRGATCTVRPAVGGRAATNHCTYFFCKGPWLQHLGWSIPQKYTPRSQNSGAARLKYDPDAPVYVDYTMATHGQCRNRDKMKDDQQMFVLGSKGTASGGQMVN